MFSAELTIAPLDPSETDALGRIFFDAIHKGAGDFYSPEQRHAWAPSRPSGPDWQARLSGGATLVARIGNEPVGFMTLTEEGFIDLAFVDSAFQRRGIGKAVYAATEEKARAEGMERLHTQASHLVKGLFEAVGWEVVKQQTVERSGIQLTNFVMEKWLKPAQRRDPS
ncbi:MAG: GNAT family N-acetyltransferase [Pseudomonadota bacterium]